VANRTAPEVEALVVEIRQQLAANPWAQVGPAAIAWELAKREVVGEVPSLRTIARILVRHDIDRRPRRQRYEPKGTDYPDPPGLDPNACQQLDLVGPRSLLSGGRFYAVNAVDLGRRKAAGAITTSKSAAATGDALATIWGRLGVPERLQMDNQQGLAGAGRSPGALVRLCLAHGVTPTFIPYSEPWRNGVVEHFNDTFDKRFFRTETYTGIGHLRDRYDQFLTFHNATHRYSALAGATPDQTESDTAFTGRPPDPDVVVPDSFAGLSGPRRVHPADPFRRHPAPARPRVAHARRRRLRIRHRRARHRPPAPRRAPPRRTNRALPLPAAHLLTHAHHPTTRCPVTPLTGPTVPTMCCHP